MLGLVLDCGMVGLSRNKNKKSLYSRLASGDRESRRRMSGWKTKNSWLDESWILGGQISVAAVHSLLLGPSDLLENYSIAGRFILINNLQLLMIHRTGRDRKSFPALQCYERLCTSQYPWLANVLSSQILTVPSCVTHTDLFKIALFGIVARPDATKRFAIQLVYTFGSHF